MQAVMAGMVAAMRERPKAAVVLAVLLIVAGLTLGLAREAIAYTFNTGYDRARKASRGSATDTFQRPQVT